MKRIFCALLLVMFCVACGLPIPTGTTAVRGVSGSQPDDETDLVKRIPPGPAPRATPAEIVQGFLASGNDSVIAREYLTAANPWSPTANTTVFTGDPVVKTSVVAGGMTALATIAPILFISNDGSTQVPKTGPMTFTLKRENGEWRIAQLPEGTELDQSDLASSFRRGVLGWLSPDGASLVRESVLLPDPENLIPNLVTALIGGPSPALVAAAVGTAIPSGVTADPPVLEGSQLTIALHTNGATIATSGLKAIRAQFAATLLSSEVSSIVVTVNGQPLLGGASPGAPITPSDETFFDRDIPGSDGQPTTSFLATAGGIAPLVLPVPFVTATPTPSPTATSTATAKPGTTASPRVTPSAKTSPSASASPSQVSGFSPGVPISAFAVSDEGQRFAELRVIKGAQQPVQIDAGSNTVMPLGPARDYTSLAWGADDTLWLTTQTGEVYLALRDRAPQRVPANLPLEDLIIAPDGVNAVGISTSGVLVAGLVSDGAGGSAVGVTSLSQVATSLKTVTALAVVGPDTDGLDLLVAATQTANQLVPGSVGAPENGLWRVSTGAPDPTAPTVEALSETVAPTIAPCSGTPVVGLVARPRTVVLAECGGGALEAFDQRPGPSDQMWVRVGSGLAGYPLG